MPGANRDSAFILLLVGLGLVMPPPCFSVHQCSFDSNASTIQNITGKQEYKLLGKVSAADEADCGHQCCLRDACQGYSFSAPSLTCAWLTSDVTGSQLPEALDPSTVRIRQHQQHPTSTSTGTADEPSRPVLMVIGVAGLMMAAIGVVYLAIAATQQGCRPHVRKYRELRSLFADDEI